MHTTFPRKHINTNIVLYAMMLDTTHQYLVSVGLYLPGGSYHHLIFYKNGTRFTNIFNNLSYVNSDPIIVPSTNLYKTSIILVVAFSRSTAYALSL